MKLTWFGGTTMRVHIGGAILVVDPAGASTGIDRTELVSGADRVIEGFGAALVAVEPKGWKPRRPGRLLDESETLPSVEAWSAGEGALLVDAMGEAPLLLMSGPVPELGRWADGAVIVLLVDGAQMAERGRALLEGSPPRLLVLAGTEAAVDAAVAALRELLDGTGLVALQAGLALEA